MARIYIVEVNKGITPYTFTVSRLVSGVKLNPITKTLFTVNEVLIRDSFVNNGWAMAEDTNESQTWTKYIGDTRNGI